MREPIYAVLVVYNRSLADCPVFEALRKSVGVTTFVCDNSTADYQNAAQAARYGLRYLSMDGNKGLSVAYNRALDTILREETGDALICIFDDDTTVLPSYFDTLRATAAKEKDADVFLPFVYDAKGLLSPCKKKGVRFVRCEKKDVAALSQDKLYGINSGMALRSRVFRTNRYDEGCFLDCVDFALLRDLKEQGYTCTILDVSLGQAFSATTARTAEQKKTREKIYRRDFAHFCDKTTKTRLAGKCYLLARRMKKIFRK